jgi:hypothetical protein
MSLYGGLLSNKAFNSCISASGGDEIGTFYSGSQVWKYHKFNTLGTGSFTIHSGSTSEAKVLLIGGGGGGGRTINTNQPSGLEAEDVAGGGGAGGVLFLEYTLTPRTYDLFVGDGGESNENGEDTQMYPLYDTNDQIGEYFPTASQLTAEGGGYGAYVTYFATGWPFYRGGKNASGGGSGGGGVFQTVVKLPDASRVRVDFPQGSGRVGQGNDGGYNTPNDPDGGGQSQVRVSGAGGAGSQGEDAGWIFSSQYIGRAGEGINLNVDGTPQWYAAGGPGLFKGGWLPANNGNLTYGAGGYGNSDSSEPSPTNQESKGRQGIIVIMYPLCQQELDDNCTQYTVNGGANGGEFTYVSCASASLETYSIGPTEEGLICSYDVDDYPSTTGDVILLETGSCEEWFPFITGSTCDTASGEETIPITLIELVCNTPPVGFGPPSNVTYPGYITVRWENYLGNIVQGEFSTGTHYICGKADSAYVALYTVGASWSFGTTDTICAYYCGIPIDPSGSLITSGGYGGDYVIGNDVYGFNTFNESGQLNLLGGTTDKFDILVVGGGGSGGRGGGGGGGAGGFITSSDNSVSSLNGRFEIQVGDPGNISSIGGNFLTESIVAYAGGAGGNNNSNGQDGASGGGGGESRFYNTEGGDAIYPTNLGNDGARGQGDQQLSAGGGGGGAGAPGDAPTFSGEYIGGNGGIGVQNDFQGYPKWYSGGGNGSRNYTTILGGGGAYTENGEPNTGGGGGAGIPERTIGGSGQVVVRFKKGTVDNPIDNSLPVSRSLWSLVDIGYTSSYDGTGDTLYDISNNYNNAVINNRDEYEYNTLVLDSGSLILRTSSLDTSFNFNLDTSTFRPYPSQTDFTLLVTWFGNNLEYNTSSSYFPIFSDNDSDWGIYGGDLTTWDNGIVINAGGQLIGVGEDTAGESGGGFIGWHISQVSYESSTNTIRYNCDNVSGSVIVSGSSLPTDFNPKWNDKLLSGKMGDNTAVQVLAIYTQPLTLEEMRINHDSLDPRY